MNLGQLVRAKMKELAADMSGEYIDGQGKHYTLTASGDGYTVKYGGKAQHEIEVSKQAAIKLASHCRKI